MLADRRGGCILVRLEQLEIPTPFGRRPAQDQRDLVNQTRLRKLFQAFFVVGDVDHAEDKAQVVLPLQRFDARVDVLWVQTVVLEAEEETAGR